MQLDIVLVAKEGGWMPVCAT